jgi:hypothetical protein
MDKKQIDSTRAIPRQTQIDAEPEIRDLSLNERDHVAGGTGSTGMLYLQFVFRRVF